MLAILWSLPKKTQKIISHAWLSRYKKNPAFDLARVAFPPQKNPEIIPPRMAWIVPPKLMVVLLGVNSPPISSPLKLSTSFGCLQIDLT